MRGASAMTSPPPEPVTVFINEKLFRVRAGLPAAEATAQYDPALPEALRRGTAYLTDGRGIRLAEDEPVAAGAIIRVVRSTRSRGDEADAQP